MDKKYNNYSEFVKDSRNFNNSLIIDRRLRSPFIDTQTGVAQTDCTLWRTELDRQYVLNQKGCNTGTIYSYPASKWQKKRREYLLNFPSPPPTFAILDHSNQATLQQQGPSTSGQAHLTSYQQHYGARSHQTQFTSLLLAPSRADSTGSHSCVTVDSDSRDLSTATSQSFDSPRHHQLEEELPNGSTNYVLPVKERLAVDETLLIKATNSTNYQFTRINEQQDDDIYFTSEKQIYSELTTSQQQSSKNDRNHQLDQLDRTKEAIRLHSRMSKKKKNIGQSLIKNRSILVKADSSSRTNNPQQIDTIDHSHQQLGQKNCLIRDNLLNCETSKPNTAQTINSNGDRPYICSICDQTYKTRPGLSYHFIHTHNTTLPRNQPIKTTTNIPKRAQSENGNNIKSKKRERTTVVANASSLRSTRLQQSSLSGENHIKPPVQNGCLTLDMKGESLEDGSRSTPPNSPTSSAHCNGSHHLSIECQEKVASDLDNESPQLTLNSSKLNGKFYVETESRRCADLKKSHSKSNPFCDFCLGTADRNRRTKLPEKLISCTACGSSGHPSCLRFSDNIKLSVQKYDWQCIECKTCSTCNNADNEDQLLFCDDCDRSYHTYCLNPPLMELPEGNWSCSLCLVEYYGDIRE